MMSVPESLERLLTDLGVSRGVHEKHAQEHDVASDASCLSVMNLESRDFADLRYFNVEEALKMLISGS